MPGLLNKVIQDTEGEGGNFAAMMAEWRVSRAFAEEIEKHDLLKEATADGLKAELESICADNDAADAKRLERHRVFNTKLRQWIDTRLGL